jgi:hypothetical protein
LLFSHSTAASFLSNTAEKTLGVAQMLSATPRMVTTLDSIIFGAIAPGGRT